MAKRLTSKRLTGKSRPSTKSQIKPIRGVQSHSRGHNKKSVQTKRAYDKASKRAAIAKRAYEKAERNYKKASTKAEIAKIAYDKKSAKAALAQRVQIAKPIKSTSDIREASNHSREKFKRKFLSESVQIRGEKNRGWNLKQRNYYFGGTALIYVSAESGSPYPVDDSAIETNHFRSIKVKTSSRDGYIRNEKAFFEALYAKRLHKNLGKMNFEQAKSIYEKEIAHEDARFLGMVNQLIADNKDGIKVDKLKWFKLIAN
jgi:hypothetical protein